MCCLQTKRFFNLMLTTISVTDLARKHLITKINKKTFQTYDSKQKLTYMEYNLIKRIIDIKFDIKQDLLFLPIVKGIMD